MIETITLNIIYIHVVHGFLYYRWETFDPQKEKNAKNLSLTSSQMVHLTNQTSSNLKQFA